MKTTLSEREGNTVKFEVEISGEELQEAFDKRLKQLSREARIPGFRQGKVPLAMLRQRLGDEAIITDAVEEAMNEWFVAATTELGIEPVERPKIDVGDSVPELGKPFAFKVEVTVMPEVVLGEYKGVAAVKESAEVREEEVDAQMERLRNEFAELRPVGDRAAQEGDFVTADFRAELDGAPVAALEATDFVYELGKGLLFAEIEAQTVGMRVEEERTFKLTLPEDSVEGDLGGKTVDFTVKLKEVKEKVLPALTDTWASEVSEFATLDELRGEIRSKMQGAKDYSADQRFRSLAVQVAADNATLELPDVVVREQAEEMATDFAKSLAARGGNIKAYLEESGITADQMIEDMKPQAARNVKTGLVLDAVAKAEGLEVTDEDISQAAREMAALSRTDAETLETNLRKSNRLEPIKWQLLRDKAADFIAAHAVPVAPGVEDWGAVVEHISADVSAMQERQVAESEGAEQGSGTAKTAAETAAEATAETGTGQEDESEVEATAETGSPAGQEV